MEDNIELLSCALEGGCSAKIPPDLLEKTLAPILKLKTMREFIKFQKIAL